MTAINPPDLVEAVARCLAKQDGQFISAEDWVGDQVYKQRAIGVLTTISNYQAGHQSGGLPPNSLFPAGSHQVVKIGDPIHIPKVPPIATRVSRHLTKAQALTAASKYHVLPPSGYQGGEFTVARSDGRWLRWEVQVTS